MMKYQARTVRSTQYKTVLFLIFVGKRAVVVLDWLVHSRTSRCDINYSFTIT